MMKILSLISLLLLFSPSGSAIDSFEFISGKCPEEVSPGQKFSVSIKLKAIDLNPDPYFRPSVDLNWNKGKIVKRLPGDATVPWYVAKIKTGDEVNITINVQCPAELNGEEEGTIGFSLYMPKAKDYAKISNGKNYFFKLKVKKVENIKLPLANDNDAKALVTVVPTIVAPLIDGVVKDDEWKQAVSIALVSSADGSEPRIKTQIRIGKDAKNFYLSAVCDEPNLNKIIENKFEHHDSPIWNNECIELSFRSDLKGVDFRAFIADILNQHFDSLSGDFAGFNPQWTSAVKKGDKSWTVEVSIPLSAISNLPLANGSVIQADFFRMSERGTQVFAWSPTYGANALINRYGFLIFDSAKEALLKMSEFVNNISAEDKKNEVISKMIDRINEIKKEINSGNEEHAIAKFLTIRNELNQYERKYGQILFETKHAKSGTPIVIQIADPYNGKTPDKNNASLLRELKATFVGNESQHFAFNVTNISGKNIDLRCSLHYGKTDGLKLGGFDFLRLGLTGYKIMWQTPIPVAAADGTVIYDAIASNPNGVYSIPSETTKQIFLSVKALAPDQHTLGFLVIQDISNGKLEPMTIPVDFTTVKSTLNNEYCPYTFGWDLLYNEIVDENPDFAQLHFNGLRENGFNTVTISSLWHLPRPKANPQGELIDKLDFSKLQKHIKTVGDKFSNYYLNVDIWEKQQQRKDLFNLDFTNPNYEKAFKTWFSAVINELQALGVSNDKLVVCPYDESCGKNAESIARWIKEVNPKVRVLIDCSSTDLAQVKSIDRYVDIWMPHVNTLNQEALDEFRSYLKSTGKPVMSYYYSTGGNEKTKNPYDNYTLQFWKSFSCNLSGLGYWAAGTYYGDPWYRRNVAKTYDTSLQYPSENNLAPARRLLAWKRGVEDYQLLKMTESALTKSGDKNALEQFRKNVKLVTDFPNDPERANLVRTYCREILSK